MINVRNTLTAHRYYDASNDLHHNLTSQELDALCAYFATCKEEEDFDEHYIHVVADNVIRKRLAEAKKANAKPKAECKISKEDVAFFKSIKH
jgi:hypothetical protein